MSDRSTDRDDLLRALYEERHREAVRLAWALCRDAAVAEELAQEAFVRVYLRRHALRDPAAAPAYLRRTVVNLAFGRTRRQRVERRLAEVDEPYLPPDRAAGLDLLDALAALPDRRRACVVLRHYLDLSEADTAAALGISVGTVKSQTHKALAQLRVALDGRDDVIAAEPVATPETED